MARARRHSVLVSRPTLEQGQRNLYTNGARIAAGEIVVSLSYNGVTPFDVPNGAAGLLLSYEIARINPVGLFTVGETVDEVFIFQEGQGVQDVTLHADFEAESASGQLNWTYQAELGVDFDSLTPSAPIGVFAATGNSTNQALGVLATQTFEALVIDAGLQLRLRLSHDGMSPVEITPRTISVTAFGASSGADLRLR